MRNSTSPSFKGVFAATGTSVTSPDTEGMTCTALRITATGPEGAPQPMGMNRPTRRANSTRTGDSFQNVLRGMNRSQTNRASSAI